MKRCRKEAELMVFLNAIHNFYDYPELEESCSFIERVRDFVQTQLSNKIAWNIHAYYFYQV